MRVLPDVVVGVDFGMTSTGVAYSAGPEWTVRIAYCKITSPYLGLGSAFRPFSFGDAFLTYQTVLTETGNAAKLARKSPWRHRG